MATTPNGVPYPPATATLRSGPSWLEDLATTVDDPTALDSGWVDITAAIVSPGTDGRVVIRHVGDVVEIIGTINGTFPNGVAMVMAAGAIPESMRPTDPNSRIRTGTAYAAGAYDASVYARASDGGLYYWMRQAPSDRSSIQFNITYTKRGQTS